MFSLPGSGRARLPVHIPGPAPTGICSIWRRLEAGHPDRPPLPGSPGHGCEHQLENRLLAPGVGDHLQAPALLPEQALQEGTVKIIDMVKSRLDARNDCYIAELPSLNLRDVRIDDDTVTENERMLTDGFYAEVTLSYDGIIAQEKGGRPFKADGLRPIQMSKSDVLDIYLKGRLVFTREEWVEFLLRSIGLEPSAFDERAKRVALLRMIPFVERNYNLVELGPEEPARAICSSRSRLTPIWFQAARRPSPRCSSTTLTASGAWYASTTWSASTKWPASPSTRRTASIS